MIIYIVMYMINMLVLYFFYRKRPWEYRNAMYPFLRFWTHRALNLIGITIKSKGQTVNGSNSYLIVSNHLSYIDILITTSQFPSCFVTSMEIKETPVLGFMTQVGGCLYVERRSKANIQNEINEISEALKRGINVTIFPEATSTNGESVLRFRRPLYNAAIASKKFVKPICINYKKINNQVVSPQNRDLLFWYGGMSFVPHLWRLMGQSNIEVELEYLSELPTIEVNEAQALAEKSYDLVVKSLFQSYNFKSYDISINTLSEGEFMNFSRRDFHKILGLGLLSFSFPSGGQVNKSEDFPSGVPMLQGATSAQSTQISILGLKNSNYKFECYNQSLSLSIHINKIEVHEKDFSDWVIYNLYIENLDPNYFYELKIVRESDGKFLDNRTFQTLDLNKENLYWAFGSCMYDGTHKKEIWQSLQEQNADFIIFVGDSVYIDRKWGGSKEVSEQRLWGRHVQARLTLDIYYWQHLKPVFATWDDHDYGLNNSNRAFVLKHESQGIFNIFFHLKKTLT